MTTGTAKRCARFLYLVRRASPVVSVLIFVATVVAGLVAYRALLTAQNSLTLLYNNGYVQLRPYLLFDSGRIKKTRGLEYEIIMVVRNTGQTPAFNTRYSLRPRVSEYPLPGEKFGPFKHQFDLVDDRESADVGASRTLNLHNSNKITIAPTDQADIQAGKKSIYVLVNLKYQDLLGRNLHCTQVLAVNVGPGDADGWMLRTYYHSVSDGRRGSVCQDS